eukprot:3144686-Pleurochrysis_carterae.AAC.1
MYQSIEGYESSILRLKYWGIIVHECNDGTRGTTEQGIQSNTAISTSDEVSTPRGSPDAPRGSPDA